ncbi:DUF1604-domain-containing protein [Glonium stellatum]|uniref:DUF1604-domain-containing protein n=1 Tax=Glonium stellatum TaxID=574774 RepID=A0A8E2JPS4_9PEZI|nr:DUF1604-domain-containing protein [Glonium stellatum]
MAHKRPRSTFEADLQTQQSPFVFYGTALPPLDPDVRDDGSYVPVWKQSVTDEHGRKRLHGAFTGGFSAGYFNTVGSKEGWTPSVFVSSRTNRHQSQSKSTQQRPEDFMDEEDLADAAEDQRLQTTGSFSALGSTKDDLITKNPLADLIKAEDDTTGTRLLQRMGWRRGQGIGPRIRRKARLDDTQNPADHEFQSAHLFAPENQQIIGLVRKNDRKGLGYIAEIGHAQPFKPDLPDLQNNNLEDDIFGSAKSREKRKKPAWSKSGFGVGILNDTGSDDDDDPYEIGPRLSYNRVLGPEKRPKRIESAKPNTSSANPLLAARPIFVSKKSSKRNTPSSTRKCHDGRFPLDGYVLSNRSLTLISQPNFLPPKIPPGWKTSKLLPNQNIAGGEYKSVGDTTKATALDPKSRATILGEPSLPGKSVFDYLSVEARNRIASTSGKKNLPPALDEPPPTAFKKTYSDVQKELWNLIPHLAKDAAVGALSRGTSGWMPYSEDEGKRARYRAFLELRAGLSENLPERVLGMSIGDWRRELEEFAHAAQVFKPITGMMATRFTSSTSQTDNSSNTVRGESGTTLLRALTPKPEDPSEEAAKLGMYGPMTRTTQQFFPTRLVCKRFNVKPPAHVQLDPGAVQGDDSYPSFSGQKLEIVSKSSMNEMLKGASFNAAKFDSYIRHSAKESPPAESVKQVVVNVEQNEALEADKAGDAVFRAVFGSEDEDESGFFGV